MNNEIQVNDTTKKIVVYYLPEVDAVSIQRDIEYLRSETGELTMGLYYPPDSKRKEPGPLIIFVNGYPDSIGRREISRNLNAVETSKTLMTVLKSKLTI